MITLESATQTLRDIIAEAPEGFVYESPMGAGGDCLYYHREEPSCIVGHFVERTGLSSLMQIEEANSPTYLFNMPSDPEDTWQTSMCRNTDVDFSNIIERDAVLLLEKVQNEQDHQIKPWHECLRIALDQMRSAV